MTLPHLMLLCPNRSENSLNQFTKVENPCYSRDYCHNIYTEPLKLQLIHFLQCNSINLGHLTPNKSWKYKCQMLFMAVQSNDIKECNSARSFGTYQDIIQWNQSIFEVSNVHTSIRCYFKKTLIPFLGTIWSIHRLKNQMQRRIIAVSSPL